MNGNKEPKDRGGSASAAASGRRPLLTTFAGNNRQMLQDIRDSLSHLRKNSPNSQNDSGPLKPSELSQSTPNLAERTNAKMGRLGYHQKALAKIRADLNEFNKGEDNGNVNGLSLDGNHISKQHLEHLVALGYDEDLAIKALKLSDKKGVDGALEFIQQLAEHGDKNGITKPAKTSGFSGYNKVIRKPSFEEKYRQMSPVSVTSISDMSIRSDSPSIMVHNRLHGESPKVANSQPSTTASTPSSSANTSIAEGRQSPPPPPIPPRSNRPQPPTPPPPPLPPKGDLKSLNHSQMMTPSGPPGHVQQMIRRMSSPALTPAELRPHSAMLQSPQNSGPVTPQRGVSPVTMGSRTPSSTQLQTMNQQFQNVTLENGPMKPPPPYTQSPQIRQSPVVFQAQMGYGDQLMPDYRPSPAYDTSTQSSGSSSPASSGQSPVFPPTSLGKNQAPLPPKPAPMQAWGAKATPIIMQSVKSREVQKPVLQTATVPTPQIATPVTSPPNYTTSVHAQVNSGIHSQYASDAAQAQICLPVQTTPQPEPINCLPLPPRGNVHIEIRRNRAQQQQQPEYRPLPTEPQQYRPSIQIHIQNNGQNSHMNNGAYIPGNYPMDYHPPLQRKMSPDTSTGTPASRSDSPISRLTNQSPISMISTVSTPSTNSDIPDKPPPPYPGERVEVAEKHRCTSPIPERKPEAKEWDEERKETKVKNYSPQAFKFYMEQHVENVLKSYKQRVDRRVQLEREMAKVALPEEAQCQMRRMLHQKESNYIRLKRAKMDKCMFDKIKALGIGAFGEVALVRKTDSKQLYAMKTLRKRDVLQRNQVAHVKAERDILAEADNEWVVKLYFSFQDRDNLYFVMDYIPGGDMMSLLIKFGIFQEDLARFYIAELVLAIESVHKMGFIHRDIKPDNILIDKSGHIKLTDFGLCTGFRWTHNSKYYQKDGHARQDSMDVEGIMGLDCDCTETLEKRPLKPLERRKKREQHQRCLAHSLVGTPNYIAPEVLLRSGYTASCDWWSVGVILYEMLVGQPPFLANTPAETQYKVINWPSTLRIPKEAKLSPESEDLILKFICDPSNRLGSNGSQEIKSHPFFESIQCEGLRHRPAPYKPQIKYATDTSNFDPVEPDKLHSDDTRNNTLGENGKHPEHAFFEFTFRRFFDDGGPYSLSAAAAALAATTTSNETSSNNSEANSPVYV